MAREGSLHPDPPTTRAGTPATVMDSGTSFKTTEPAATLLQLPILMLPRILEPAPIRTPSPILGCRSLPSFIVSDHRGLADDEPRCMIQENTFSDSSHRINIGLENR